MVLNAMSLALGYILSTGALQTTPPPIEDQSVNLNRDARRPSGL